MDLSALVLKQPQNGELKLSGKAPGIEGDSAVEEGFPQTLSEYLDAVEGGELATSSKGDNESAATTLEISPSDGNELPFREKKLDVGTVELNSLPEPIVANVLPEIEALPLGEAKEALENRAGDDNVGEALSIFLSGLPGNFTGDSINKEPIATLESATLFNTEKGDLQMLKAVSDFLQEKEPKVKIALEPFGLSALKPTVLPTLEKEPLSLTLPSLTSDINQMVTAKESLPAMSRPLGHPEWGRELSERINWMAGKTIQAAELRLNPARLGPVEVHVQVNQDQVSVMFSSPHAAVREALEQALPRLREMMTAQQFEQVDVDISHQSFNDKQDAQNQLSNMEENVLFSGADEEGASIETIAPSHITTGEGLLSYYV